MNDTEQRKDMYFLKDYKNLQYCYKELEKLEHKDYPSTKERKDIYSKWYQRVKDCEEITSWL